MSDYFAALAARTLQPDLSVQPRRRALFEHATELPGAERESDDATEPPVAKLASEADVRVSSHRPPRPVASTESTDGEPPRLSSGLDGEVEDARRDDTRATSVPEQAPTALAVVEHAGLRIDPQPTVRATGPLPNDSPRGTAAEARPVVVRVDTAPVGPSAQPLSIAPRPNGRPADTAARGVDRAAAGTTISIHIGRVDVRAVTQAPAAQAPPRDPKRGLMSLDEYMQQRSRGRS
jgi:hypothetical protein